jgi:hypothetical protein
MADSVSTYINDHLAGATQAIDLLEHLRSAHASDSLGQFANTLLVEILADREKLRETASRIGTGSNAIKEVISHVAEKVSLLKLGDKGTNRFRHIRSFGAPCSRSSRKAGTVARVESLLRYRSSAPEHRL